MSIHDGVQFTEVPPPPSPGDLPFVTHEGVLEVAGHKMRVYRISDGRAIINQDDFHDFFDELGEPAASEVSVQAMRSA
jgi:hypothetical protein